jgi:hypothetical protein
VRNLALLSAVAVAFFTAICLAQAPATQPVTEGALPKADNDIEEFFVDQVNWMNRITPVLAKIKSPEDARAAVPDIEIFEKQASEFRDRVKKLSMTSKPDAVKASLAKYGEAMKSASRASKSEAQRITNDAALRPILEKHLSELAVFGTTTRPAGGT